jgi:hypothetical protein
MPGELILLKYIGCVLVSRASVHLPFSLSQDLEKRVYGLAQFQVLGTRLNTDAVVHGAKSN